MWDRIERLNNWVMSLPVALRCFLACFYCGLLNWTSREIRPLIFATWHDAGYLFDLFMVPLGLLSLGLLLGFWDQYLPQRPLSSTQRQLAQESMAADDFGDSA